MRRDPQRQKIESSLAPAATGRARTISMKRYIFPNSSLPSAARITEAAEGEFIMEDRHNFGPDYDRTLVAWYTQFENARPALSERYDERFRPASIR